MADVHDTWLAGLGLDMEKFMSGTNEEEAYPAFASTPASVAPPPPAASEPAEAHHEHPGALDRLLGLNPDKSFVQTGMEALVGEPGKPGPLAIHDGDGIGVKLARAAGIVAALPAIAVIAIGGDALDNINHVVGAMLPNPSPESAESPAPDVAPPRSEAPPGGAPVEAPAAHGDDSN